MGEFMYNFNPYHKYEMNRKKTLAKGTEYPLSLSDSRGDPLGIRTLQAFYPGSVRPGSAQRKNNFFSQDFSTRDSVFQQKSNEIDSCPGCVGESSIYDEEFALYDESEDLLGESNNDFLVSVAEQIEKQQELEKEDGFPNYESVVFPDWIKHKMPGSAWEIFERRRNRNEGPWYQPKKGKKAKKIPKPCDCCDSCVEGMIATRKKTEETILQLHAAIEAEECLGLIAMRKKYGIDDIGTAGKGAVKGGLKKDKCTQRVIYELETNKAATAIAMSFLVNAFSNPLSETFLCLSKSWALMEIMRRTWLDSALDLQIKECLIQRLPK